MPLNSSPFNSWNSITYTIAVGTSDAAELPRAALQRLTYDYQVARAEGLATVVPALESPLPLSYSVASNEDVKREAKANGFSKWIQKIESS